MVFNLFKSFAAWRVAQAIAKGSTLFVTTTAGAAALDSFLETETVSVAVAQPPTSEQEKENSDKLLFKPKVPYHWVATAGVETSLAGEKLVTPVVRVLHYVQLPNSQWDILTQADSLGVFVEFEYHPVNLELPTFGAQAFLRYLAHANYRDFNTDGTRNKANEVDGHESGVRLFTNVLLLQEMLKLRLEYEAFAKMYGFPREPETAFFPSTHFTENVGLTVRIGSLQRDIVLGRQEGLEARLFGRYQHRPGYTQQDLFVADNQHSFMGHAQAAGGILFSDLLDLQGEVGAGVEAGTDLYNATFLGGFFSTFGPAPGEYFMGHRHSQWIHGRLALGTTIASHYHVAVEGHVLWLPADNRVVGGDQPTQDVLPAIGLSLHARVAGVVPIALRYAYSPLAERPDNIGGHSLVAYVAVAFGKIENGR